MARNGSGTYSLFLPGNPVVTNTVISSVWANGTLSDLATAMTQSLAYDGQTNPVANLPMATFRHTGVGNAVNLTDYASASDAQNGTASYLTGVAGADTITATAPYSMAAYTAGQNLRFIAVGANTGAVTLNVNGIGAIAVTKLGASPLVAGDIALGQAVDVILDGVRAQMVAPSVNALPYTQIFTGSGSFTMPAGYRGLLVECIGGGGGGGSGRRGAAGTIRGGGCGGGGGARTRAYITSVATGTVVTVTVGAGGTGALGQTVNSTDGNLGTDGGNSSFGTYLTAYGGQKGGYGQAADGGIYYSAGGGSGSAGGAALASNGSPVSGQGGAPSSFNTFGALYISASGAAQINNNTGGGGAGFGSTTTTGCAEWGGGAGAEGLSTGTAFGGGGSIYGGCGGGGGGSINAADVNRAGGTGGTNGYVPGGGAAANAAGAAGTIILAGGGGGGGTGVAGAGLAGGAGGSVGGGGGGGSASLNGNTSGAGGDGGRGEVRVWCLS